MSNKPSQDNTLILEAANALLDEMGTSFTMDQLESKVNISRSTIYRRIGNKNAILEKLAHQRSEVYEKLDVRLKLLSAARTVFGREGFASATMEQIAHQADMGVATVYRHFGTKESLIRAFIEDMTPRDHFRELTLHPTRDIQTDLEQIVSSIFMFFNENREIARLIFMGNKSERRYLEGLRTDSESSLKSLSNYFQSQMNAGRLHSNISSTEMALGIMGMILAFTVIGPMHYKIKPPDIKDSSQKIIAMFLTDHRKEITQS